MGSLINKEYYEELDSFEKWMQEEHLFISGIYDDLKWILREIEHSEYLKDNLIEISIKHLHEETNPLY